MKRLKSAILFVLAVTLTLTGFSGVDVWAKAAPGVGVAQGSEAELIEDWKLMSAEMRRMVLSNSVTKEELQSAANGVVVHGTTGVWKSFQKINATYEKEGSVTGYMALRLGAVQKAYRFHAKIPLKKQMPQAPKKSNGNSSGSTGSKDKAKTVGGLTVTDKEWEILRLINIERYKQGLALLTMVEPLQTATATRAKEEAAASVVDHERPDGTNPSTAIPKSFKVTVVAENLFCCSQGHPFSAWRAVHDWMLSPGHRKNILRPNVFYTGVGVQVHVGAQLFSGTKNKIVSWKLDDGGKSVGSADDIEGRYLICTDSAGVVSYLPLDVSSMKKVKGGYQIKLNAKKAITLKVTGSGKKNDNKKEDTKKDDTKTDDTKKDDANKDDGKTDNTDNTGMKNTFTDVDAKDAAAVAWVTSKAYMEGINETEFGSKMACTRGDVLAYLYYANGLPKPSGQGMFVDVRPGDPYYNVASWAQEKGLIEWGSMVSVNDVCPRGYALYYVWLSVGAPEPAKAASFTDFNDWVFYAKAVAWAEEKGILKNSGDSCFHGDDWACTRADMANFLYGAYK